jgi:GNAT superfamily N-acetyltransferase
MRTTDEHVDVPPAGEAERPSIQMLRPHLEGLPPLKPALSALPQGYRLRSYLPRDVSGWTALMNTGQMGEWTAQRTREQLTGRPWPQFDPAGLFVVTSPPAGWTAAGGAAQDPGGPAAGGAVVASACAWLTAPEERETGTLHMVCVLPEHRGRGLSYPLCLAVLHRFRERGFRRVRLNTHDWRLGAVKVYLRLGFQPLYRHPRHPDQWTELLRALRWTAPVAPQEEPGAWPAGPIG